LFFIIVKVIVNLIVNVFVWHFDYIDGFVSVHCAIEHGY